MADISITAANVLMSSAGKKKTGIAAATTTAGQLVYLDTTTNQLTLADGDALASAVVAGVALHGALAGQPLSYCYYDPAFALGGTVAVGIPYFASLTAGGIAPEADLLTGDYTTYIGLGASTTTIKLVTGSDYQASAVKA